MAEAPKTILVVDDEPSDVEAVEEALRGHEYCVLTTADAEAALRVHSRQGGHIDLLISDIAMSPLNGIVLAQKIREVQPDLQIIFVSGYVGEQWLQGQKAIEGARFLRKPLSAEILLDHIRELLGSGASPESARAAT